jgi:hypothetical protein
VLLGAFEKIAVEGDLAQEKISAIVTGLAQPRVLIIAAAKAGTHDFN